LSEADIVRYMRVDPSPRNIVEKILDAHSVHEEGERILLYVDRLILADTARSAFNVLEKGHHAVRRPAQALLIPDHFTPSRGASLSEVRDPERRDLLAQVDQKARQKHISVLSLGDARRGIQHVVATEQALTLPGAIVVAADSHTPTQGALGALAFSVGTDLAHVLATQCVWVRRPKTLRIALNGTLAPHVTAKDVVMMLVAEIGSMGASGLAVEYVGSFIEALSVEGRMTICNMSVEMGARFAIVAPDQTTINYLRDRPLAPTGAEWEAAVAYWETLPSDEGAFYNQEMTLDVSRVEPMVTWGCNTENAIPISGAVPDPVLEGDADRRAQMERSLDYMALSPQTRLTDLKIDQVFIGSCSNSTLEDLRSAAEVIRGQQVVVPTLIVPGSGLVKAQAEAEGLDIVFTLAGASWGEAGCSMCCAMNGDVAAPGARCASTSNRNHMGRQGPGSRTHLVSPPTAALCAIKGCLSDISTWAGV